MLTRPAVVTALAAFVAAAFFGCSSESMSVDNPMPSSSGSSGVASSAAGKANQSGAAGAEPVLNAGGEGGTDSPAGGAADEAGAGGMTNASGAGGTAGSSNSGGSAGTQDTGGSSGLSGSAGTGGSAGTSGSAGTAGTSGTAGTAGSGGTTGSAGTAGTAGSGGTAGSAGTAGSGGTAGSAGTAGASGNVPNAPTGLTATPGPASALLSWTAPANNGSAIIGYEVSVLSGPISKTVTTTGISVTVLAIPTCNFNAVTAQCGRSYTFQVRAQNAVGFGAFSSSATAVPHVSYVGDNVAGVFTHGACLGCHSGGHSPDLENDVEAHAKAEGTNIYLGPSSSALNMCGVSPCISTTSNDYKTLQAWVADGNLH